MDLDHRWGDADSNAIANVLRADFHSSSPCPCRIQCPVARYKHLRGLLLSCVEQNEAQPRRPLKRKGKLEYLVLMWPVLGRHERAAGSLRSIWVKHPDRRRVRARVNGVLQVCVNHGPTRSPRTAEVAVSFASRPGQPPRHQRVSIYSGYALTPMPQYISGWCRCGSPSTLR